MFWALEVSFKTLLKWLKPTPLPLFPMIPSYGLVATTGKLDGSTPFWRMSVVQKHHLKYHPIQRSPQIPEHCNGVVNEQRKGQHVSRITAITRSENPQKPCYKSVNIKHTENLCNSRVLRTLVLLACFLYIWTYPLSTTNLFPHF